MQIKEAIILAGGLGTRLRSAVPDLPKCMAPVNDKPFLTYVIDYFIQQRINKFIFSLGYKHEVITNYLDQNYPLLNKQYSIEQEPLGTGGAIRLACKKTAEKTVLVLNGDTMFNISLAKLSSFHQINSADCTLSLKPMNDFDRYGVVELKNDFSIKSFNEKQFYKEGLINGGVYALAVTSFLNEDLPAVFSFEKDYLEKMYGTKRFFGLIQDAYFIDIGIPEDFRKAQVELKNIHQ